LPNIHGTIAVASTYENTGIALGILHGGLENDTPVLSLTFDGNFNRNDQAEIEAFIHYLQTGFKFSGEKLHVCMFPAKLKVNILYW
jgi:hypothetical protein